MKRLLLSILFLFSFLNTVHPQPGYEPELTKLHDLIEQKEEFDELKLQRIARLESKLKNITDAQAQYNIYLSLYNEYKTFNYDKSFHYAHKLQEVGRQLKDPSRIAYGSIKLGFILLSSGMFKETFDSLRTVNIRQLPDSARMEYYFLTARTYYDLADFDKDKYYTPIYNNRAAHYIDSAITLSKPGSYENLYYKGLRLLKMGNTADALIHLRNLLENKDLSMHEEAVTASTLSDIYIQKGNQAKAISLLIRAAIADIRTSTREAAAMLNLAQLLHKEGDIKNAYTIINQAMNDATYYGARQRKMQVSAILLVIASEKINSVEEQRRVLFMYAASITLLSVLVVTFAFIIYRQLKKLKKADKIIVATNQSLQNTIHKLNEADKIKEEYIGYYFNLISEYISKLEKFKRSVDNRLTARKFDDIRLLIDNINLKKEREDLFIHFDKAFLNIFPNFVEAFNAFFNDENHVKLLPGQLLNTDLRIFALIRLGITDTEKIANILEYSLNTIYNYKTRIKSKSHIPNDDFEAEVMSIKTI